MNWRPRAQRILRTPLWRAWGGGGAHAHAHAPAAHAPAAHAHASPPLSTLLATPYDAQRSLCQGKLEGALGGTAARALVANIDAMQGREVDVCICSLVRTPSVGGEGPGLFGRQSPRQCAPLPRAPCANHCGGPCCMAEGQPRLPGAGTGNARPGQRRLRGLYRGLGSSSSSSSGWHGGQQQQWQQQWQCRGGGAGGASSCCPTLCCCAGKGM